MQEIQKRKRQLESELKQVIDKFHKENRIYKVTYVSAKSDVVKFIGRKNDILNSPVRVEVNIEVV